MKKNLVSIDFSCFNGKTSVTFWRNNENKKNTLDYHEYYPNEFDEKRINSVLFYREFEIRATFHAHPNNLSVYVVL